MPVQKADYLDSPWITSAGMDIANDQRLPEFGVVRSGGIKTYFME